VEDGELKAGYTSPTEERPDSGASAAGPTTSGAAGAAASGEAAGGKRLDGLEQIGVHDKIVEALRTCYDPEIPVNIYELGLVYEVRVEPTGEVVIKMTLTSPNCPVAGSLPIEVREKAKAVPGVTAVKVDLVWEPMWDPSKMTEAARLQLGIF
jgi:FeS assembly SUF system protein